MLRRTVTALPRAKPISTYWTAQANVIGELLRARATLETCLENPGTAAIHRKPMQRSQATKLVRPFALPLHQPTFKQTSASPILGTLTRSRPQASAPRFASQSRAFHASHSQRLPAPVVLLAAGALLKASFSWIFSLARSPFILSQSTGAWAVFSVLSRILFTLVPVSLMASRKISAKGAKYAKSHAPASISPTVRKFFTTFCEGEVCKRPKRKEMWRTAEEKGGSKGLFYCPGPTRDRRAVFSIAYRDTVNVSRQRTGLEQLADDDIHFPESRHAMWFTPFFYLPELSPAARRALDKLSNEEKEQLFELRCHEAHKGLIASKVKKANGLFMCFILLPFMVFAATALLSLERTPYSGRWRFIMLSPEAEDEIARKLRGPGWYQTVISLLTTPAAPAPPIVPIDDWRWHWVNSVLRRLEAGALAECANGWQGDTVEGKGYVIPPPPQHPLHPRPRAACYLHAAVPGSQASEDTGTEHLTVGPPYSLLLLQDDERNALSMGWGSQGAGGVVVYTGMLDEILADTTTPNVQVRSEESPAQESWFQSLFGTASHRPSTPPTTSNVSADHPVPTEEQTIRLACVLAHELAHLLLAHHLEALSASQVLIPNVTGLASDLIRTLIFPVTMVLGPFVNDFISDISKRGMDQTKILSDICFSRHQEREADLVSLRLLAYASFDPEQALSEHWAKTPKALCGKDPLGQDASTTDSALADSQQGDSRPLTFFRGVTHDSDEERLDALMRELDRWKAYAERRRRHDEEAPDHGGLRRWAAGLVHRARSD